MAKYLSNAMRTLRFSGINGDDNPTNGQATKRSIFGEYSIPWIYLASMDGEIAIYPGTSSLPSDYEPLHRPWFKSSKKQIEKDLLTPRPEQDFTAYFYNQRYFTQAYTDVFSKVHTFVATLCTPLHTSGWDKSLFLRPEKSRENAILLCIDIKSGPIRDGIGFYPTIHETTKSILGIFYNTFIPGHPNHSYYNLLLFIIAIGLTYSIPLWMTTPDSILIINPRGRRLTLKKVEISTSGIKLIAEPKSSENEKPLHLDTTSCRNRRTFVVQLLSRRKWLWDFQHTDRTIAEGALSIQFSKNNIYCRFYFEDSKVVALSVEQWRTVEQLIAIDTAISHQLANIIRNKLLQHSTGSPLIDSIEVNLRSLFASKNHLATDCFPPPESFRDFILTLEEKSESRAHLERLPISIPLKSLDNFLEAKTVHTVLLGSYLAKVIEEGIIDDQEYQNEFSSVVDRASTVVRYIAINRSSNIFVSSKCKEMVLTFTQSPLQAGWATYLVQISNRSHAKDFAIIESRTNEKLLLTIDSIYLTKDFDTPPFTNPAAQKKHIIINGRLSWRCDDLELYQQILNEYESQTPQLSISDLNAWLTITDAIN